VNPQDVRDSGSSGSLSETSPLSPGPFDLPCIRCGVCCTVYQVRISPGEAREIADSMGMDYWDWVGRYCDARWSDPRSHLIKHDDHGCVFLDHSRHEESLCGIYRVRPSSCRDWPAGVFKPACQAGLREIWRVSVDDSGQLQGDAESISALRDFFSNL
jgi:uncharacterized protein